MSGGTGPAADTPAVIVFPPLILLAVVVLGVVLDWAVPLDFVAALPLSVRVFAGLVLLLFGVAMIVGAKQGFDAAGTNIRPDRPTTSLVTTGLFAHTRNPVYIGGELALLGLALLLGSAWILVLMVPATLLLHYGVVLREERYLERKFGAAYLAYKESVPRYGWTL
jgi:protein-S-isoprenylcysteine O-methyltransferase Ste14